MPRERWVVRAMNWFPENARRVGHMGFDDSALLQAQANWKLARTCPEFFFLDEPIRWFSFLHWHLMNVKCTFNLLCLPAPWMGCLLRHAGLTDSLIPYSSRLCGNGGWMLNMHSVALTCKMVCRNSWVQGLLMMLLLFARTAHETLCLLENLTREFAKVGPFLGGEKTVVLPNAAPTPIAFVDTDGSGVKLQVKNGSGRLGGRRWTSLTTCTLLPKPSVRIQTSCVGRYLAPGFLTNCGGCFFLSEPVPWKPQPVQVVAVTRLECDGVDKRPLTEAMGTGGVGVRGGKKNGWYDRERWCLVQQGWQWKLGWHMGPNAIGAWPVFPFRSVVSSMPRHVSTCFS